MFEKHGDDEKGFIARCRKKETSTKLNRLFSYADDWLGKEGLLDRSVVDVGIPFVPVLYDLRAIFSSQTC